MPFSIKIEAPGAGTAATEIAKVETQLEGTSVEAAKLRAELDKATAAAQKFAENTKSLGQKLADQLRTAQRAMTDMLAAGLDPAARAFGKLNEAIAREQAIVERIRGPIREYYADLVALDMAHKRGALTTAEFTAEMERLTASRRASNAQQAAQTIGFGPGQGADAPKGPGIATGIQVALGTAAALGITEAIGKVKELVEHFQFLRDKYIEVSNVAIKFVDATHTVNQVIAEQLQLANDLHSNIHTTIDLYDAVRDGTDELNISHREQIALLKTLGEAAQVAGKPLESVGGLIARLTYAAARGRIEQRELNMIMREVPEIATNWLQHFGTTRQGLLTLVDSGKISVSQLLESLISDGNSIHEAFTKIQRTEREQTEAFGRNVDLFISKGDQRGTAIRKALDINAGLKPVDYAGFQGMMDAARGLRKTWDDVLTDFVARADDAAAAARRLEAATHFDALKLKREFDDLGLILKASAKDGIVARVALQASIKEPVEAAEIALRNLKAIRSQLTGDQYQKQYEALVTTINDGRLPATIKLWHELSDPLRENAESVTALNAAFAAGGIGAAQYNTRLNAINDVLAKLRHDTIAQEQAMRGVPIGPRAGGVYVTAAAQEQAQALPTQSLAEQAAGLQPADLSKRAVAAHELNEAYARQFELAGQTAAAEIEYQKTIDTINGALALHAITQARANQLTEQAKDGYQAAKDALAGYSAIVEQFEGPQKRYEDGIRAANDAFRDGRINAQQLAVAIDQNRAAFLAAAPAGKTFAGALEQSFLKAKLEAQSFGQQLADTLVSDVEKLGDALVTMAFDGEVSWKKMIDAMLLDLARLAARQLALSLISAGVSAISGGAPVPLPIPGADIATRTSPGAYPMPGAATSYAGATSSSGRPIVKIVNVFDRAEIHAAMDSREGEQITVNQMRRNAPAVRSYSGTRR